MTKFSIIALTAATLSASGAHAQEGVDINGDPVFPADAQSEATLNFAGDANGLQNDTDVNGDVVRQARTDGTSTIVAGAQLDTQTDINGEPVRKNRTDVDEQWATAFMTAAEARADGRSQFMLDAIAEADLDELHSEIAANVYLNGAVEDAGYEADDVLATYVEDGTIYIVVDG